MVVHMKYTTIPLSRLPDMRGQLFKNIKKQKETHSDYYGEIVADGYEYWVNAWIKQDVNGVEFLHLQLKGKPSNYDDNDKPVSSKGKDYL